MSVCWLHCGLNVCSQKSRWRPLLGTVSLMLQPGGLLLFMTGEFLFDDMWAIAWWHMRMSRCLMMCESLLDDVRVIAWWYESHCLAMCESLLDDVRVITWWCVSHCLVTHKGESLLDDVWVIAWRRVSHCLVTCESLLTRQSLVKYQTSRFFFRQVYIGLTSNLTSSSRTKLN